MNRTIRRILFWSLFFIFLVSTPIAVLYTQGYRFDNYKMIFIHTGSITIKSVPASPAISINGKPRPSSNLDIINSSITIGGLRPGSYDIKISSEAYSEWEKNVDVHSGLSTEFWNVVLIPQNPALKELPSSNVRRFFSSPFGKKIAYVQDSSNSLSISVIDVGNNESKNLFSSGEARFTDDDNKNIEWSPKEDFMLCPILRSGQVDYLVLSATDDSKTDYLSDVANIKNIRNARWSPKENGAIYFLAQNSDDNETHLYRTNINNSLTEDLVQDVTAYDLSSNSIYFLQSNNILYKSDLDGKNLSQIISSAFTDQKLGDQARLIAYDDSRQALITDDGDLFVHNDSTGDTIKKLGTQIKGIQFSNDGKKLLFWDTSEIDVLYLRKWEVQPYREENEVQSISRFSTPLKNVFWYKDYEHVFFSTGSSIRIIELDPRDHRVSNEILNNNTDDFPAAYDASKGAYYFLRDADGTKSIFYFELPVKTGFFG